MLQPVELENFEWWKDSNSYELINPPQEPLQAPPTSDTRPTTYIATPARAYIRRLGGALESYQPWKARRPEDQPVHQEFADKVVDADSALTFVRKYGFLGLQIRTPQNLPYCDTEDVDTIVGIAEKMRAVKFTIDVMLKRETKKKGFGPELTYLAGIFDMHARTPTRTTPKYDEHNRGELVFVSTPESLLSWLWLGFAAEITFSEWRKCKYCGTYFPINPSNNTERRRKFCNIVGKNCRQREAERKNAVSLKRKEAVSRKINKAASKKRKKSKPKGVS